MTTVRSGTFSEQGTTSSVVVSKPPGAASGEKLIVFIGTEDHATVTCTTRPTGFTKVNGGTEADPVAIDTTGNDMRGFAYEKTLGGSEGSTYTFTMSASTYVSWCAICTNGASGAVLSTTARTQASVGGVTQGSLAAVTLTADQLAIGAGVTYEAGAPNSVTNWSEPTGSTRMGFFRTSTDATNELFDVGGYTRWFSITLILDAAGGGSTPLTVQDATHGHTVDNVALTQHHVLTVADAAHGSTSDAVALTQHNVLAVDDGAQAHTVDNVDLSQRFTLTVADSLHGHTVDAAVLTQHNVLTVADTVHGHGVDNLVLSGSGAIVPDDTLHAHTVDNVTLTQHHVLTVAETFHAHTADNVVFVDPDLILTVLRMLTVRAEDRTLTVAAETRTVTVQAVDRTLLVEAP